MVLVQHIKKEFNGDIKKFSFIITMDCDGTHNPTYISKMLKVIKDQNTQLVSTNRFLKENSQVIGVLGEKFLLE